LLARHQAQHEEDHADHEEDEEQDLCDSCGRSRDAGEPEKRGDDRDDKEKQCPFEHIGGPGKSLLKD